jgi:formamidopyrimidine-DNA glycosylase
MPELPDVETFKRYIDSTALHKKIEKAQVTNEKILEDTQKNYLESSLHGEKFVESKRHGKYLFLKTTNDQWMIVHFGMTGFVKYFKDESDKPDHTRLLLHFDNDYFLSYDCQRMLGKINLIKNKEDYIKMKGLGDDALKISYELFEKKLKNRKGMAKSTLMNQSILSGIGNIYADEILFQSGIHPKTKMNHLNEDDFQNMYEKMQEIFDVAIKSQVDTDEFPKTYIIPNRTKDGRCPKGDKKLEKTKVNGRTTYYCPIYQDKK